MFAFVGQAKYFLKGVARQRLIIAKANSSDLLRQLENAVMMGLWIWIENVTFPLSPLLHRLLDLNVTLKTGKNKVYHMHFLCSTSIGQCRDVDII